MNVSLRQLRVFRAVAEQASFSRAGDQLGLTQPAVSRAVRELEQALELRLLDRTTREVVLTDAGQRLLPKLARALDELDEVLLAARKEGGQAMGSVHVASSPTLSASLMPAIIAACRQRYPLLRLHLQDQVQRLNVAAVRGGEADFGLVVEPEPGDDLWQEEVLVDDFWLVCRGDHPLAAGAWVSWRQLDGEPLVLLDDSSGSRPLIDQLLLRHGLDCPVAQQLGHSHSVFRMAAAGIGVSITPGLAMPLPAGCGLVARPLLPRASRRIVLIRRCNRTLSPAAESLWRLVLEMRQPLQRLAEEIMERALSGN
ncbi:LysR family transcriptional regulator [Chromobacterium subtsugae]|uniref:LysR family transcriptional regulator n=1 Tax=Chromobacterium subtsugae TaxID=251747 RepID=A0ABS7FH32_9NEIS|nr:MULTISPECIES: LysR family transcriptional regulator [Chromobacterium]KUM02436.1 LysR family transcriptional regulator [Chromobacterium subtsugae]KZE87301.1 LysR family transcriptional regulator [Chromobacterium sp. F49]MBW7568348.1 LysR family transcriptional regulator [Chromobacterium subtsugae]MBW8289388.1 LysR family transcriptional regulator [Chromobacterium subtsugae]WSE93298.1 LysR family transcriptional regulator [Chromobacterium subtsugae]